MFNKKRVGVISFLFFALIYGSILPLTSNEKQLLLSFTIFVSFIAVNFFIYFLDKLVEKYGKLLDKPSAKPFIIVVLFCLILFFIYVGFKNSV